MELIQRVAWWTLGAGVCLLFLSVLSVDPVVTLLLIVIGTLIAWDGIDMMGTI